MQSEVKVAPQPLYLGTIDTSKDTIDPKSLKRTAMANNVRGDDLIIERIEPSAEWIMAKTEINKKGGKHSIVIELDKNKLQKGKFKEKVKVHTRYKRKSEVATIIIEGKVI